MPSLRSAIYRAETQSYRSDDEKFDAIVKAAEEWFCEHVQEQYPPRTPEWAWWYEEVAPTFDGLVSLLSEDAAPELLTGRLERELPHEGRTHDHERMAATPEPHSFDPRCVCQTCGEQIAAARRAEAGGAAS